MNPTLICEASGKLSVSYQFIYSSSCNSFSSVKLGHTLFVCVLHSSDLLNEIKMSDETLEQT